MLLNWILKGYNDCGYPQSFQIPVFETGASFEGRWDV